MISVCRKCGCDDRNKFGQCRPCKRSANARHRERTRGEAIARTKKWAKDNPQKKSAQAKRYREKHPDKVKAIVAKSSAVWRANNREKCRVASAKWYADHPEARRLKNHNRQARLRSNGGVLSKGLTEKLMHLQRGRCACCSVTLTTYHLDHVLPLALDGENEDRNIQLLCPTCNVQKHSRHPIDFMQSRGFLL